MPELPEVETVVRHIRPRLEGRRIEGVTVGWRRTLGGVTPARFERDVKGSTVTRVWRRAKYIVFDLEPPRHLNRKGACLVGHLRMTGRMQVGAHPGAYVVVTLDLDDGNGFHFIDVRKFGRLVYAREPGDVLPALGPEPLGEDFTPEWFRHALKQRRRQLKPLLLDQAFLAGLGNIYVDEALFLARLHPLRASHKVPRAAADKLHAAIRGVLAAAVEHEGSTFDRFYRTPEGKPGSYQHKFRVYGRTGKPCHACGAKIRKLQVAQRGTHICPRCQRAPRA